ncbi:acyl-coenzyme A diphosphatase NUDT19-like [Chironomus tepperi]|uniref:acyl-coenzyme A diphosphatase NUDT19-like n=1 Tax=Chironomus tepperi TaxID=113505 RepID=UPI00391FC358
MSRPWKDAATLIVLARDAVKNSKYDYKVLTFKRTAKSSFYANSVVFPGGVMDKSDESASWTSFFKHHKVPSEQLKRRNEVTKPFIYDPQGSNKIEREISLRLAAIRETFEELGIALCSPASDTSKSPFSDYFHSKDCDIPFWQKQVHSSHETLMNFCDNFGVVPNILDLCEWSVWLTPSFYPKRFETAFFVVTLNSIPPCYAESHEVQSYSWQTPEELLAAHRNKTSFLPPPQYFELHRFINCTKIDDIANFTKKVNGTSVPLILPKPYQLKESIMLTYPGDDLYPALNEKGYYEDNHDSQRFKDNTYDEAMEGCKNFCRIEMKNYFASRLLCNVDDGLLPACSDVYGSKI